MRTGRTLMVVAALGWLGGGVDNVHAADSDGDAPARLLAKTGAKTRDKEETGEESKKEKTKRAARSDARKKRSAPDKSELREVFGVLAVGEAVGGVSLVTLVGKNDRTYTLDLPAEALPKARALAGKKVRVRGRVRERNGEFLIDRIESCRPLPGKAEDDKERNPAERAPEGEE